MSVAKCLGVDDINAPKCENYEPSGRIGAGQSSA